MNCDLLLSWMTQVGEGTWTNFRKTIKEIMDIDGDLLKLSRTLRINFSDHGFADFFINDTQRWRILPPTLGGLAVQENKVALYGGRTPSLVNELRRASEVQGCRFEEEDLKNRPKLIHVLGNKKEIQAVANQIEVPYKLNVSREIAEKVLPIPHIWKTAREEPAPRNWEAHTFNFKTNKWLNGLPPNSPCRFSPTYGNPKYFVHKKNGKLFKISKRESFYVAAMLKRIHLIEYNSETMKLSTPLAAPMPELYTRAACLCSCQPAEIHDGRIIYSNVPLEVAALLIVAAGQPHPETAIFSDESRYFNE